MSTGMPDEAATAAPEQSAGSNLPKAYDPSAIEQKWADYWQHEHLFDVPTPDVSKGGPEPFTILLPPPNVTGRLHMGHMLNQTEMDILMRWHRMRGEVALWVPGTDHAGIATQLMVERQLAEEGSSRKALGREAFEQRVWQWKRQYGSAITEQMHRLGVSVDWSREYFTMDERLSIAVKEAFVRLWEQGLIYRGAYIVNWDPVQQTAVSDVEVIHQDRAGKLYHIRYPFADGTGSIVVATTRPETMLGDVAVAVNPNDERYKEYIGKLLTLPLSAAAGQPDREIPILADDWAQPEFGTGAVKVTPAHDPNDFAIGQRHNLAQPIILDETAHISLAGSPYFGLDRYEARKRIVEDLEAAGLLVDVKDHSLAIAISQRSGAVIEPRLSMQWFLAVNKVPNAGANNSGAPSQPQAEVGPSGPERKSIAQNAIDAVEDGHIRFTPEMYSRSYMEWMNNIHDWCISRQLWWGHRIPAWHCGACGAIIVSRETPTACGTCGDGHLTQSTDVLDTWFSSGLLPFTVFGWPGGNGTGTVEAEAKYSAPYRGYAHVKLRVVRNGSGQGHEFLNELHLHPQPTAEEIVDRHDSDQFNKWIRSGIADEYLEGVRLGIDEALGAEKGPGSVTISLIGGSHHEVESNMMAFRNATAHALKEALSKLQTPQLTPDLAAFYPTTLLVTGFDILFFWVARMIMLGCHFMLDVPMPDGSARPLAEAVPFRNVYIHGLVRDANREKMSKTKGNVVNPIDIIERFGTDATRFTLASMASPGTDIAFSEARTEGYRAFANKIWNAARFLFMNLDKAREAGYKVTLGAPFVTASSSRVGSDLPSELPDATPLETRWIFAKLSAVSAEVERALTDYRFDEAANAVYQFFWGELCDWYLELVKLRLDFDQPQNEVTAITLASLVAVFDAALRLLSPFMPFLTDEVWHALHGGQPPAHVSGKTSIALTRYPQAADFPSHEKTLAAMETMQELITTVRALRKDLDVPEKEGAAIALHAGARVLALTGAHADMLGRLARVSAIEFSNEPLKGNNVRSTASFDVAVLYEKQIDVAAERERLTKELAKLNKTISGNEARLADEKFTAKAPPHIVEGLRQQTEELRTLRDKAQGGLDALPPK